MDSLETVLAPLRGLTDGQIKPFADAAGISVHTVRNALGRTRAPRVDTYLKLVEVSRLISSSPSPASARPPAESAGDITPA